MGRIAALLFLSAALVQAAAAAVGDIVVAHVGPFNGLLAMNGEANHAGAKAYVDAANAAAVLKSGVLSVVSRCVISSGGTTPDAIEIG